MNEAVLAYNIDTGRYGIRISNTKTWINEGLSDGDKVVIFDIYNSYYVEDVILSKSFGTPQEEWYFKVTKIECNKQIILPVLLEE